MKKLLPPSNLAMVQSVLSSELMHTLATDLNEVSDFSAECSVSCWPNIHLRNIGIFY